MMYSVDPNSYDRRVEKVRAALDVSIHQLRKAIKDLKEGNLDEFDASLWSASAQAEYALFLIALNLGDKINSNGLPRRDRFEQPEDLMSALQNVLEAVTKSIERVKSPLSVDVYKDLLRTTSILVSIQEKRIRSKR